MFLARSIQAFFLALSFLFLITVSGTGNHANAQSNSPELPAGAVPGGTTDGNSSDSELWRMIRQGGQGTVAGVNEKSGLMIQSQGEEWRQIRNGPLPAYSAMAILGILLLLSLFYAVRGRVKIEHGKSDKTITRFSLVERASHWLLASSFIILALTGLNLIFGKDLLMPVIGASAFANLTIFGKYVHNYVGFAFMAALFMVAVLWIKHNFPNRHDLIWFAKGGGILSMGHPPAKKFNAGQKIIFWVVILCGISISMSGWALLNPFSTTMFADTFAISNSIFGTDFPTVLAPIQEQQYQSLWHAIMAVFMIVVIIAHIYIGSVGMEGALDAMTSGEVDENWAMEHHSLWVEEVKSESKNLTDAGRAQPAE
ncbi:MAG: formate dehydrogenase subunit gamma [Rhizobiaceae bacterium]|nr:formate dehydrogenase subunit gamma [Rhizobiaceae bacterium]